LSRFKKPRVSWGASWFFGVLNYNHIVIRLQWQGFEEIKIKDCFKMIGEVVDRLARSSQITILALTFPQLEMTHHESSQYDAGIDTG
jgi:hypothetical protein